MPAVKSEGLPRVLLAEDQQATLNAISAFLSTRLGSRYNVIGTTPNGSAFVSEALRLAPELAVVDIAMPEMNGIAAAGELKARDCPTKVILLTMHWEREFVDAALGAGAAGYVLKHRMVSDLPLALEAALRGALFVSPLEEPGRA